MFSSEISLDYRRMKCFIVLAFKSLHVVELPEIM